MNFEQWWEDNVNLNNVEKKVSEVLWDFAEMAKEAAQAAWEAAQKNMEVEPSATDNKSSFQFPELEEVVEYVVGNSDEGLCSIEADAIRTAYDFIVGNKKR